MHNPTIDPDIVIVGRGDAPSAWVEYRRLSSGQQWRVTGSCNQCGLCVIGAVGDWYVWDGPPGTPGASRDTRVPGRLDDPVTPELLPAMIEMAQATPTATVTGCSLSVEAV